MKKILGTVFSLMFVIPMIASANMGDGYGYEMMSSLGGFMILTWLVWFIVGILAAVWLWQQISKK
ncbi:MAG: hypothetical protein AAB628_00230 [Patescibacteria group bacterium]